MKGALEQLRRWARSIKAEAFALYLAARDPRTPWYAKVAVAAVAAYALSPIDLIPDFIPVLGYLDDLLIVPAGIYLALRLIPPHVLAWGREQALRVPERPKSYWAAGAIVLVWVALAYGAWTMLAA